MTVLRAIVRTLSDSAGFADPATDEHGLIELTDEQLDQVAGGGGALGGVLIGSGAGSPMPDGRKSGITGNMG
jgi:hypothetical protein